ncbi:unnamed protein product [Owenia fusiformis]|uniref:Homeobox domain-containing protein n=1 Tax=Owenia fusiformis TaxID=6347 RepID=A0A8J1T4R4_OWEFU|nr:unnamed protein product [Owenia fusiformis]
MASMVFYNNGSSGQLGQFSDALTYAHLLQNEKFNNGNNNEAAGPPTGRRRRDRTHFSERAIERLEASFTHDQYPDINTRELLAEELGISEARVQVWFQNKRSRLRRGKAKLKTVQPKPAGTPKTQKNHLHSNNSPPNNQHTPNRASFQFNKNPILNMTGATQMHTISPSNNSFHSNQSSPSNEGSPVQTVVKSADYMLDTTSQDSFSSNHSDSSFTENNNVSVSTSKLPPPLDLSKGSHQFAQPNPNPTRYRTPSQSNDSVKPTHSVLQSGMCSPFTLASPFFPYSFPYGYTPMMEQRQGGYYFSPMLGSEYPKTSMSPTTMQSILSPLIASPMGPRAFLFPSGAHNVPSMNFTNSGVPQPQHGVPTGFAPFQNYGESLNTPKLVMDLGIPSPKPSPTSTTQGDSPSNKENGNIHSYKQKEKDINVWD